MNKIMNPRETCPAKTAPRRSTILTGRKDISAFLGRSWKTVRIWMKEGAPIVKIGGRLESDSEALLEWRRKKIEKSAASGDGDPPRGKLEAIFRSGNELH